MARVLLMSWTYGFQICDPFIAGLSLHMGFVDFKKTQNNIRTSMATSNVNTLQTLIMTNSLQQVLAFGQKHFIFHVVVFIKQDMH